ncbi:Panacea domain-containing protein [Streptosporangium sp. DT93]|uniref:Panacea domain-containing protein n=1 Tax=Streptosporangium sp. DT93 TaxID=3393428 RepID=UPI003CF3BE60
MDLQSQPSGPLVSSTLAILKAAREYGFEINKTKLAKLLYMADLSAVESDGVQFTGATWRWDNYGPYDSALARVEYELSNSKIIERNDHRLSEDDGGRCELALVVDIDDPLPAGPMQIIRDIVRRYGNKNATGLRELSYKTAPMIEAQAGRERGVLLDLSRARRRKQVRAMLMRAGARRAKHPPQGSDPGVCEQLRAEFIADTESIRRANERVLGDL